MTPVAFHVPGDEALTHSALLYQADSATATGALYVLAHGAGAGQSHPFMVRYARGLAERGFDVVTFDFPYMQAGRKTPDRAPVLEEAFRRVVAAAVAHRHVPHDSCSSAASRWAGAWRRISPPRRNPGPPTSRHWPASWCSGTRCSRRADRNDRRIGSRICMAIRVPTLIVQGTRDKFGGPADITAALTQQAAASGQPLPPIEVYPVEGGDHSLTVRRKTERPVDYDVWDRVADFASST